MKTTQEVVEEEKKIFNSLANFLIDCKGCNHTQAILVANTLMGVMVAMVKMESARKL